MPAENLYRVVRITTPKRYLLDGLLLGGGSPKTGIAFVHGLGSNAFAHHRYLVPLADRNTVILFFSNRGHDGIAGIKRVKSSAQKGYVREQAGVAHEVFTDCADDIQGAVNLLRKYGAKRIYLVGHSTGCQKVAYYLSRRGKQARVAGAALLCPISDYASASHENEARRMRAERLARKLIRQKKPHELLPTTAWPGPIDAQRFLSLYTQDSEEEIFTYAQPAKIPRTLQKLTVKLLVAFAGDDEYRDRDTREMAAWFRENLRSKQSEIRVVPGASHSFTGQESTVADLIRRWVAK